MLVCSPDGIVKAPLFYLLKNMKIQFLIDDNYQTMYINGVKALSGKTLDSEDVALAIVGAGNVEVVNIEDFEDDEYVVEEDNIYFVDGEDKVLIWDSTNGHPEEYPFEYE
jgi:hypothetical protein